jgi:threonine synthase
MVSQWMGQLAGQGRYVIPADSLHQLQSFFYGGFAGHEDALRAIREGFEKHGYLMDPHTAVGYSVLQEYREETGDAAPALLASTASPFKFNQAVLEALGRDPSGRDEFRLLEELAAVTGQPIAEKLVELKSLPEIHTGICTQQGMAERIYQFLGIQA